MKEVMITYRQDVVEKRSGHARHAIVNARMALPENEGATIKPVR